MPGWGVKNFGLGIAERGKKVKSKIRNQKFRMRDDKIGKGENQKDFITE